MALRLTRPRASTVVVAVGSMLGLALVAVTEAGSDLNSTVGNVATILWVVVGAVLVARRPRHRVGWLAWLGGLLLAVGQGAAGLATYGLTTSPGAIPGALWLAWLALWIGVPGFFVAGGFLPLVYPTGALASARWRSVAVVGVVTIALFTVRNALGPFPPGYPPGIENPFLVTGPVGDLLAALGPLEGVLGLTFAVGAAVSIILRFRRATGVERQQLRFFTFMVGLLAISAMAAFLTANPIAWLAVLTVLGLMPVAIAVAVLRYRLYDLDLIVSRTIVYGLLTAILAGSYAAIVGLLQRFFVALTGTPSDAAIVVTTLIVVGLFTPIRNRLQSVVDQRFKETRDPVRRLNEFTTTVGRRLSSLNEAIALGQLLGVAALAYGATGGTAWLGAGDRARLVARVGDPAAGDPSSAWSALDVSAGHPPLARIVLGPRRDAAAYREADREALSGALDAIVDGVLEDSTVDVRLLDLNLDTIETPVTRGQPLRADADQQA
jgi:hypothetical protein